MFQDIFCFIGTGGLDMPFATNAQGYSTTELLQMSQRLIEKESTFPESEAVYFIPT